MVSALCEALTSEGRDGRHEKMLGVSDFGLCGKHKYSISIAHYALLRKTWATVPLYRQRQKDKIQI